MAKNELVFKSASELGRLIQSKKLSPVEVVGAYLDQIDALNESLNAFITVTREQAMDQARQAEKDIRSGKYLGPLHGLPYAAKDIFATKGIRTTNGSKVTADWIPAYESTATERLNKAGAILVGKTNLGEFATGGFLSGFGQARNPWHLDYSPAGSSGGSGAALAGHLVPLATGTDTGGSIRGPAAANGIVGMKPTYGRISRFGVTTLSWSLDHAGPMTRTVSDLALMLQVMAGHDPKDRTSLPDPVPQYTRALSGNVKGLKIGVPSTFFFDKVNPEVEKAIRAAIQDLVEMGATTLDVSIPHVKYATSGAIYWPIVRAEAASYHEKRLREKPHLFDPLVREKLEGGKFVLATDYLKAQRVRALVMQEVAQLFDKCDVLAVPASGQTASKRGSGEFAAMEFRPGSELAAPSGTTNIGNLTGIPAIVMPCGFSQSQPQLPIAIQFYAKPLDEPTLLRVSHAYETAHDWTLRRPPTS